jgi:hypothetical protein
MARGRWMERSLMLEIEGEMDAETLLVKATDVGRQVEAAIHVAVPKARQVRWAPVAIRTQGSSLQPLAAHSQDRLR